MANQEIREKAQDAILNRIVERIEKSTPESVLMLSEAYAWLVVQNQAHGGR